jgi:hypothetical protein
VRTTDRARDFLRLLETVMVGSATVPPDTADAAPLTGGRSWAVEAGAAKPSIKIETVSRRNDTEATPTNVHVTSAQDKSCKGEYDIVNNSAYRNIPMTARLKILFPILLLICGAARAETPEEWVKLLTRVHGGFGSFLPVGIRIGEDAMKRLNAGPRELSVVFQQGEGVPCPCPADGVMLAVGASPGQGTLQVAPEKSPPGTFAVVVIRPRKGGDGLKYTVPMAMLPKLGQINSTIQDPRGRYDAVMAIADLYTVEPVK